MADTMARRIRDLEYWRNGNGSKGAETRLRDVETLAEEVKTGKACTAKDTLGSIQKKIDKLEKQSIRNSGSGAHVQPAQGGLS